MKEFSVSVFAKSESSTTLTIIANKQTKDIFTILLLQTNHRLNESIRLTIARPTEAGKYKRKAIQCTSIIQFFTSPRANEFSNSQAFKN